METVLCAAVGTASYQRELAARSVYGRSTTSTSTSTTTTTTTTTTNHHHHHHQQQQYELLNLRFAKGSSSWSWGCSWPFFVLVFPHHGFRSDDTGKPTVEDVFLPLLPHVRSTSIGRGWCEKLQNFTDPICTKLRVDITRFKVGWRLTYLRHKLWIAIAQSV